MHKAPYAGNTDESIAAFKTTSEAHQRRWVLVIHDQRVIHGYINFAAINSLSKHLWAIREYAGPFIQSSANKPVAAGMQV